MPYLVKGTKALGIYNQDYHEKYRHEIHNKRYTTYINLVMNDIKEEVYEAAKKSRHEFLKKVFPMPNFVI